eukprot:3756404-Amphidinium_carterae.2
MAWKEEARCFPLRRQTTHSSKLLLTTALEYCCTQNNYMSNAQPILPFGYYFPARYPITPFRRIPSPQTE